MLIGGDDISNDVITLGTRLSMFVDTGARFRFALIGRNLTAQSMGSHRELEVKFKFQGRISCKLSSRPGELALRLDYHYHDYHDCT